MTSPLEIDPESPWAAEAEEIAASARHYSDLGIASGLAYRQAQQEAYMGYLALDSREATRTEAYGETDANTSPLKGLFDAVRRGLEIFMAGFAPELLTAGAGAGPSQPFPRKQRLPPEWFGGRSVVLRFHRDPSGVWYVAQQGSQRTLVLQLLTARGELLGKPLQVGETQARLPTDLSELAKIQVQLGD